MKRWKPCLNLQLTLGQSVRSAPVFAASAFAIAFWLLLVVVFWFIIVGKLGSRASLCWRLKAIDFLQLAFVAWLQRSRGAAAAH